MQYKPDKFINATLFFAEHTNPKKLGVTKLMKLLFFADFLHYERYGRSILGDKYFRLPEGPVPSRSFNFFRETFEKNKKTGLEENIKIIENIVKDYSIKEIKPLKKYNSDVFSDSDIEVLSEIAKKFYNDTGTKMASETHEIPFIKEASRIVPIDYRNVIEGNENKEYVDFLRKMDEQIENALQTP